MEKEEQIKALQHLVEVTHKEASILSKSSHEIAEKLKCFNDNRDDKTIKQQNILLQEKLENLRVLEKEIDVIRDEKVSMLENITLLKEKNKLLQQGDKSEEVDLLKKEIHSLQGIINKNHGSSGYKKEQIFSMIEGLNFTDEKNLQIEQVVEELKNKFSSIEKPFRWQVWKGEKKVKKVISKNKISVTDLGKGLKI